MVYFVLLWCSLGYHLVYFVLLSCSLCYHLVYFVLLWCSLSYHLVYFVLLSIWCSWCYRFCRKIYFQRGKREKRTEI